MPQVQAEAGAAGPPAIAAAERSELQLPARPAGEKAAGEQAADAAFDGSPVPVDAWLARFSVVDADDHPVADAVVTLWAATRRKPDPAMARLTGIKGNSYSGHAAEAVAELHTDVTGSAQMRLDLEYYCAAAAKEGIGRTGDRYLWHQSAAAKETKFVLEMPIVLHGVVRRVDGTPAAAAKVTARPNGSIGMQRGPAPRPDPVTAGADGRFTVPVILNCGYDLRAELDGAKTFSEHVWIRTGTPDEAVLTFPGGITLGGLVVDPDGKPVPDAEVSAWREYHRGDPKQDSEDYERLYTKADAGGRFSVAVRKLARYQLIASKSGIANSQPLWVETTTVRPHAEARLELLALATIRGRIEHGDGQPFAGVTVGVRPETGEVIAAAAVPKQQDLFGRVKSVISGADGSFALQLHPQTTWTVTATPDAANYRLRYTEPGVAPGREDVLIRISDEALAGCVVHGTVACADGQELGDYGVEIVDYVDGKSTGSGDARPKIDGPSFTLPPLPLGAQFVVRVCGRGGALYRGPLAPCQVGPFATDQKEVHLEFRLPTWGEVPVRVLDSAGAPARGVRAAAQRDEPMGLWPSAMPVDADGVVVLQRCIPGAHHLRVFDSSEQLCEQALQIASGRNPEVVVQLPAAK